MNSTKRNRMAGALVAVATGTLLLAACGSSGSTSAVSAAADDGAACTVKVGIASGQTGGLAYVDVPHLEGFQIWVDEVNANGGVDGKFLVETIVKDTRSDAAQSATVAAELLSEGISFLITPGDADPSIAAGQLAQEAGVPAMSWFGSAPVLPAAVGDFMFSNAFGDNAQARVLADYATEQGYKTAYTLGSPDSAYTSNLPRYFKKAFESNGGTVAGEGTFSMGQPNFNVIADEIKALNPQPDVIMTPAYEPDFPTFIKAIRGAGITAAVLGTDGIDSPTTLALGETAEGVVYTTAGILKNEGSMGEFFTKYNTKYGKDPETIYAITGYELGKILEAAVTQSQSCDPMALKDTITNLEGVQGITGTIGFKGGDRMAIREISLVQVKAGERTLVATVAPDPATVPAA
ncbi:MAG: ABC transporter substrate-binding protein [Actinomycetota bacterium]|nr:ABC transporter substrate-binding protein [Chloroflexota bacterium]MDA3022276.1 ABC transporter substrate-binding protein [Actinomycetota bacterium]